MSLWDVGPAWVTPSVTAWVCYLRALARLEGNQENMILDVEDDTTTAT